MPDSALEQKIPVSITMDEDVLQMAREAGLKEGRTLSNWIDNLLRETFSSPKPSK